MVNYTIHNTMFLCHLYHRTADKRILVKLAFVIDYSCSLGRAKMFSSRQGQLRHAGIYAMLQWLAGGQVCLSLPLDHVSWRKNVLNVPASFCIQDLPSSCDLHIFVL